MAEHYLHRAVGHVVEETAVVAHHQQGAAAALEVVLEPFDGLDVEVVGRLVEQQQPGLAQQYLRELYAHVPALGEGLGPASELVVAETEAEQGLARLHLRRFAVAQVEPVVEAAEFLDQG